MGLDDTVTALDGEVGRTGYEVSLALFRRRSGGRRPALAVAEALAHLERLVASGRAARGFSGRAVTYTRM